MQQSNAADASPTSNKKKRPANDMYDIPDPQGDLDLYDTAAHNEKVKRDAKRAVLARADALEPHMIRDEDGNPRSMEDPEVRRWVMAEAPETYRRWLHAIEMANADALQQKHKKVHEAAKAQQEQFMESVSNRTKKQERSFKRVQAELQEHRNALKAQRDHRLMRVAERQQQQQATMLALRKRALEESRKKVGSARRRKGESDKQKSDQMQAHWNTVVETHVTTTRKRSADRNNRIDEMVQEDERRALMEEGLDPLDDNDDGKDSDDDDSSTLSADAATAAARRSKRMMKRRRSKRNVRHDDDAATTATNASSSRDNNNNNNNNNNRHPRFNKNLTEHGTGSSNNKPTVVYNSSGNIVRAASNTNVQSNEGAASTSDAAAKRLLALSNSSGCNNNQQQENTNNNNNNNNNNTSSSPPSSSSVDRLVRTHRSDKAELLARIKQHDAKVNSITRQRELHRQYALAGSTRTVSPQYLRELASQKREALDRQIERKYNQLPAQLKQEREEAEARRKAYLERVVETTHSMRQFHHPHHHDEQEQQQQHYQHGGKHTSDDVDDNDNTHRDEQDDGIFDEEAESQQQQQDGNEKDNTAKKRKSVALTATFVDSGPDELRDVVKKRNKQQQEQQRGNGHDARQEDEEEDNLYVEGMTRAELAAALAQRFKPELDAAQKQQLKEMSDAERLRREKEVAAARRKDQFDHQRQKQLQALEQNDKIVTDFRVRTLTDVEKRAKEAEDRRLAYQEMERQRLKQQEEHRADVRTKGNRVFQSMQNHKLGPFDSALRKPSYFNMLPLLHSSPSDSTGANFYASEYNNMMNNATHTSSSSDTPCDNETDRNNKKLQQSLASGGNNNNKPNPSAVVVPSSSSAVQQTKNFIRPLARPSDAQVEQTRVDYVQKQHHIVSIPAIGPEAAPLVPAITKKPEACTARNRSPLNKDNNNKQNDSSSSSPQHQQHQRHQHLHNQTQQYAVAQTAREEQRRATQQRLEQAEQRRKYWEKQQEKFRVMKREQALLNEERRNERIDAVYTRFEQKLEATTQKVRKQLEAADERRQVSLSSKAVVAAELGSTGRNLTRMSTGGDNIFNHDDEQRKTVQTSPNPVKVTVPHPPVFSTPKQQDATSARQRAKSDKPKFFLEKSDVRVLFKNGDGASSDDGNKKK